MFIFYCCCRLPRPTCLPACPVSTAAAAAVAAIEV